MYIYSMFGKIEARLSERRGQLMSKIIAPISVFGVDKRTAI